MNRGKANKAAMSAEQPEAVRTYWLSVIGRCLAYQSLHLAGLKDALLSEQGEFLIGLGLCRKDAAAILGTTEPSFRVTMSAARKGKRSKNAKKQATK